jgi:hypothetical protein
MAKYLSNRQQNLKIGITSYTESSTVLEVTGKVGIGTTNATADLDVGDIRIRGALYDKDKQSGNSNEILISTGVGVSWSNVNDVVSTGIGVSFNNINIGENISILDFTGTGISSVTSYNSEVATITIDLQSNLDGGSPTTNYGGIESIEAGRV